jgi:tight adherence protein C
VSPVLTIPIALSAALGVALIGWGFLRWRQRHVMARRVQVLDAEVRSANQAAARSSGRGPREVADRLGARVGKRFPRQITVLSARMERAGMSGGVQTVELLGWKIVCAMLGTAIGLWFVFELGAPGLLLLVLTAAMGWFGIDVLLAHYHNQRRTLILRDLPTVMDLLVLSLEAGMGLDRALRTATAEYRSALSDEIGRVLRDVDLGLSRGEAFQRMADRVDLDDLRSLSRAIVQSEELGVSLVSVMQTQTREVRVSRRRAAEAEALRAPIKMLVPLVVFILPTLFMLLIGPVGLRAANALSGAP